MGRSSACKKVRIIIYVYYSSDAGVSSELLNELHRITSPGLISLVRAWPH